MNFQSALYEGSVIHQRMKPKKHRLRYNVFTLLLDLEELSRIDNKFLLFGYNRWAALSFFDRDHGNLKDEPLRPWVESHLATAGIEIGRGAIRLLCYPRIFGYVFNPISVFFCYRQDSTLAAILYEVCNTFKERHTYVIPVQNVEPRVVRQTCRKMHYVSPFVGMDAEYHFRIIPPRGSVNVVIRQEDKDGLLLAASFQGVYKAITKCSLIGVLVRFPFMTLKVMVGIHWEALKLWLKGTPVFTHVPGADPVQSSITLPKETRT